MVTILYDVILTEHGVVENASSEGIEVFAPSGATRKLAEHLEAEGYAKSEPVRILRAEPYLYGPPHRVEGISLALAQKIDFFGESNASELTEFFFDHQGTDTD